VNLSDDPLAAYDDPVPPSLSDSDVRSIRDAVHHAAERADVHSAVHRVYADLANEIARRRPICEMSGRCCRFEEYGHRLYVTTMELAAFLHDARFPISDVMTTWNGFGCPFQTGKLCGVHAIRPFGCRIFFCDPTAAQWQNDRYEHFHATLKRLHDTLAVPYFYLEWRQALGIVFAPVVNSVRTLTP
jgi:Fe-S-cluster containining protein